MKEKEAIFIVNGEAHKAIFNLNVMQSIQIEYGTFTKWGELTDGYAYDANGERIPKLDANGKQLVEKVKDANGEEIEIEAFETKEVDIKALIFGIKEMLNEAIDIDNEKSNDKKPFFTDKQVGRLITAMGIANATSKLNKTVIDSTKSDEPKNE